MSKPNIGGAFFFIMRPKRKRWFYPVDFALINAGLILVSGERSAIAPFIYSLF